MKDDKHDQLNYLYHDYMLYQNTYISYQVTYDFVIISIPLAKTMKICISHWTNGKKAQTRIC